LTRPQSSQLSSFSIGLLAATFAGCVASARPAPGPALAAPPPTGAAVHETAPPPAEPPTAPAPPPAPAREAGPRLAWVNPARCLSSCAYDPGPELLHVNKQGEVDEQGKLRLVAGTQVALLALLQAARAAGHTLRIESAYRSYADQARVFADIKEPGRAARPGHSEHQLGTVADLRLPTRAAIDWLAAHAHEFGFALSYPPGKQKLTGYRPEPWHVRYVGRELADELFGKSMILEEYFRAHPARGESGSCADCPLPISHAACGDVTPEGSCEGSLLRFCYDGALVTIDCATTDQQCGVVTGSGRAEHDCVPRSVAAAPIGPRAMRHAP
jgi:D-alanyl-D-alanine carboxypeptidase